MQPRAPRLPNKPTITAPRAAPEDWQSPGNIPNFLRCLRLLDLDLLPDWPRVTKETFSTKISQQNLQFRCKAVEWSLYRLFEIYDLKETECKLKPFFPPIAPLLSLNLRAALYRSLTELKKKGVLGENVVLRKTMLDECKGDKFEEVIGTFAMMVLRKTCLSKLPGPIIEQTGLLSKEQLVSLILANRLSLQHNLKQRDQIRDHAEVYIALLGAEGKALEVRQNNARSDFRIVDVKELDRLREHVSNSWIGDDRWVDILLEGRSKHTQSILDNSFQASWEFAAKDRQGQMLSVGLASELSERIGVQETRLKIWKTFQASLQNAREAKGPRVKQSVSATDHPSMIRFEQHKSLRLDAGQVQKPVEEPRKPFHQFLFDSMNEELTVLHDSGPIDNSNLLQNKASVKHLAKPAAERNIEGKSTMSSTPITVAASIQSEGYLEQHVLSSHLESFGGEKDIALPGEDLERSRTIEEASEVTTDELSVGMPETVDADPETPKGPSFQVSAGISSPDVMGKDEVIHVPLNESIIDLQSDPKLFTLAEPTGKSTDHSMTWPVVISPAEQTQAESDLDRGETAIIPPPPDIDSRNGTLLERTRHSMSMRSNPPRVSKTSQSDVVLPHFSEIFPINQFETPRRQPGEKPDTWTPVSGSSTPRHKLFSEEADYASVFKSRPRIAVSPALSPERSGLGLDSMLDKGVGDLILDDAG